jgi:hypothetical protein
MSENGTLFKTLLGQNVPLFKQFSLDNSKKYPFQDHCFQNPPMLAIFDEFLYPKPVTRVTRSLAKLFLLDFAVAHSYPLQSQVTPPPTESPMHSLVIQYIFRPVMEMIRRTHACTCTLHANALVTRQHQ